MASGLELYEALKPTVGEEAARMMAEALPISEQAVTRDYLDARLGAFEARIFRWMLGFFATLWVAQAGMIAAILVKL